MSLEVTFDIEEQKALREALADIVLRCAAIDASYCADQLILQLHESFGGSRVYFQSRKGRLPEGTVAKVRAMIAEAKNDRDICEKTGVSRATLWRLKKGFNASSIAPASDVK